MLTPFSIFNMNKYTRLFRRIGLWCIIILAVIGMSLAGGVPIPLIFRRKDKNQTPIELVEEDERDMLKL